MILLKSSVNGYRGCGVVCTHVSIDEDVLNMQMTIYIYEYENVFILLDLAVLILHTARFI